MLCYQYGIGTKQSDVKAQQIQNLLKQIQSDIQEAIKSKKTTVTVSGRVDGEREGEDDNRHQLCVYRKRTLYMKETRFVQLWGGGQKSELRNFFLVVTLK